MGASTLLSPFFEVQAADLQAAIKGKCCLRFKLARARGDCVLTVSMLQRRPMKEHFWRLARLSRLKETSQALQGAVLWYSKAPGHSSLPSLVALP